MSLENNMQITFMAEAIRFFFAGIPDEMDASEVVKKYEEAEELDDLLEIEWVVFAPFDNDDFFDICDRVESLKHSFIIAYEKAQELTSSEEVASSNEPATLLEFMLENEDASLEIDNTYFIRYAGGLDVCELKTASGNPDDWDGDEIVYSIMDDEIGLIELTVDEMRTATLSKDGGWDVGEYNFKFFEVTPI